MMPTTIRTLNIIIIIIIIIIIVVA